MVENTNMKMRFSEIGGKAIRNDMELGKLMVNRDLTAEEAEEILSRCQ